MSEKKIPSAKELLDWMRFECEDCCEIKCFDTKELAKTFRVSPKDLYDHDCDTGPLFELMRDGKVDRCGASCSGFFEWSPTGSVRISWGCQ